MKSISNNLTSVSRKKIVVAIALATALSGHAVAFSEGEFNSTLKQFSATSNCNIEGDLTKKVDAWLNQDYMNSLQEAELDASCKTLKSVAKSFNAMLKQEPQNALLMSYAGAATARLSLADLKKNDKLLHLEQGSDLIQQSLGKIDNAGQETHGKIAVALEVRFVAANAYLTSFKSMKQHAQGEQLLKELLNDQQFSDADIAFRGSVWMSAAALALEQQKRDEAIVFLNEVIENNAPQSDNARVMIRNLS